MGLNFSSSKSKSTPVDMTPDAFKGLQGPLAQRLMGLLGFSQQGGGGTTTGGTGTTGFNPTGAPTGQPGGNANAYAYTHPGWTDTGRSAGTINGQQYNWFSGNGQTGNSTGMMKFPATPPASTGGGGGGFNQLNPVGQGNQQNTTGLIGQPTYDGPLTAGIGANEQAILNSLMKNANGTAPDSAAVAGLKEFMRRGLNGNAAVDNPFLQSYIQAAQQPTRDALIEDLTRSLPGRFTQAGQFTQPQGSSAFDRAAAIATRGSAQALGKIATDISYNQVNDAQNRGLDAAKAIPGASAQEVDTLIKNLQAQALPRLIKDQGIERGLALFQTRLDALLKTLGITAGVTQPTVANEQSSKSSGFGFSL